MAYHMFPILPSYWLYCLRFLPPNMAWGPRLVALRLTWTDFFFTHPCTDYKMVEIKKQIKIIPKLDVIEIWSNQWKNRLVLTPPVIPGKNQFQCLYMQSPMPSPYNQTPLHMIIFRYPGQSLRQIEIPGSSDMPLINLWNSLIRNIRGVVS